jgi:hypothetical protein
MAHIIVNSAMVRFPIGSIIVTPVPHVSWR